MLTAGAIAPAVEQIASPVTGICPRSENLKFYVNYAPCNLLFVKVRSTEWLQGLVKLSNMSSRLMHEKNKLF